jgi:hypothetical protein
MIATAKDYIGVDCINCENFVHRKPSKDKTFKCHKCGIEWVVDSPRFVCDDNIRVITVPHKFLRFKRGDSVETQCRILAADITKTINTIIGYKMFADYEIISCIQFITTTCALKEKVKTQCVDLILKYYTFLKKHRRKKDIQPFIEKLKSEKLWPNLAMTVTSN